MKIIVGLGNPGKEYYGTRHNIGFRVVDRLAEEGKIAVRKREASCLAGTGVLFGEEVVLAKPRTFMNESGHAAQALLHRAGVSVHDLIVVHDDLDLELGRLRIKTKGGHGGHRGILSIMEHLGTDRFVRLKIGIGRPGERGATDHVLTPFRREEAPAIEECLERVSHAVEKLVSGDIAGAMNQCRW